MTEIPRLEEVGSPELRELLREARSFEPSTERRDAIVRGLDSVGLAALLEGPLGAGDAWSEVAREVLENGGNAAGGASTVTATVASGLKVGLPWKVIAVGTTVLATGGGLWSWRSATMNARDVASSTQAESRRPASQATSRVEREATTVAEDVPQDRAATSVPEGTRPVPVEERRAKDSGTVSSRLSEDLKALRGARNALRAGRPAEASRILAEIEARGAEASLRLEAEVLRIESLMAMGETEAARTRARRFVEANPRSLLAERLRAIAGTAVSPPRDPARANDGKLGEPL